MPGCHRTVKKFTASPRRGRVIATTTNTDFMPFKPFCAATAICLKSLRGPFREGSVKQCAPVLAMRFLFAPEACGTPLPKTTPPLDLRRCPGVEKAGGIIDRTQRKRFVGRVSRAAA